MEQNGFKHKGAATVEIVPANSAWKLEKSRQWLVNLLMIGPPILLCAILVLIYMLSSTIPPKPPYTSLCLPSAESNSSYLANYLERFERVYFHHWHHQAIYRKQGVTSEDIRLIFRPYDPSPNATKNRTDEAAQLLDELNALNINTSLLKLRERKAVHVTKAVLRNNNGWAPYAQNYYIGDWLLGPDMFCWQPICGVFLDLNGALPHFKPHNIADLKKLSELFKLHNRTFEQYIDNLKLGALTGYVRPRQACQAGLFGLKYIFYKNVADGNESGIYEEDFSKLLLNSGFFEDLSESDNQTWAKDNALNVTDYFNQSLFENIARPAIKMLRYVETEHLENCPDSETITNGLGRLPLAFLYQGSTPDTSKPATQRLPTGEMLDGPTTYQTLMEFFTSLEITPQDLRQRAVQRLREVFREAEEIAMSYTEDTNNRTAVNKFILVLQDPNRAFNAQPFPANESGEEAFAKCRDNESAQAYCPKRWSAMNDWVNNSIETLDIIRPYLSSLFHENGAKKTVPVCPVAVVPWFHPYSSFHSYSIGDKDCNVIATQGLPFFLERYGPKWTEYTTTGHEQLPGHHLEVQSFIEYFEDSCTDPIHWLSSSNYFPAMTEGWATYVEYQLLPQDTQLYTRTSSNKEIALQRYGMIYYQILAALRAVVDIDLNFYGKTREDALQMYDEFVWEKGHFAQTDITRIQSAPGIVTSYMIGQMKISDLRAQAEQELGSAFSLKDFHYQILRQGELPLPYLEEHIQAYISCRKEPIFEECNEIL